MQNIGNECLKAETPYATNRCNTLPWQVAVTNHLVWRENLCCFDRILSLPSVAQIRYFIGLNSCNISQQQNKCKKPCCSMCALLRQVAATKFKSTNESVNFFPMIPQKTIQNGDQTCGTRWTAWAIRGFFPFRMECNNKKNGYPVLWRI